MAERIDSLREMAIKAVHRKYRKRVKLSVLDTETAKLSVIRRKALGFNLILEQMPKYIASGELIVGARTLFSPRATDQEGLSRNLDFEPDAETLAVESPGFEFYPAYLTEEEKVKGARLGVAEGYVTSHCAPGFVKVLRQGFGGLCKEAEASLQCHRNDTDKTDFLIAELEIIEGIQGFMEEYALVAEAQIHDSEGELDSMRRRELHEIARICRALKSEPASSFHEALQLVWFTHLFMLIENYNLMSLGRPDQYLLEYYLKDLASRKIDHKQALELLACFFIKLNDGSDLHTDNGLNIIISGLKPDGSDGTNELSWLFMDAYEKVRLVDPQINIRWHSGTDRMFLKRAMKLRGEYPMPPMMFNDEVLIPGLTALGVSMEDARDYCIDACQDILIPGKSDFYPIFAGTYGIHLLTIFERILPTLPDSAAFDDFYGAFKAEIAADVARTVEKSNAIDALLPVIAPTPVLSLTLEGCLEKGMDKTAGGTKYNYTGFIGGGLVNVVDSLAAIKKHVFVEKSIAKKDLMTAIADNFIGWDDLRKTLKFDSPKWGNADPAVDGFGAEIAELFSTEVLKYHNPRGGRFVPGLMTHHQVRLGKVVPATPDGRKQGEPLAVSLSPSIGQMKKGPTCALISAMRINHRMLPVGTSVDLTIQNSFLRKEADLDKLISMTESFFEGGGLEVQYNIVDPDLLRAAQAKPEDYLDLVVRVWGFNAYFVTLQHDYQDELIARAETGVH